MSLYSGTQNDPQRTVQYPEPKMEYRSPPIIQGFAAPMQAWDWLMSRAGAGARRGIGATARGIGQGAKWLFSPQYTGEDIPSTEEDINKYKKAREAFSPQQYTPLYEGPQHPSITPFGLNDPNLLDYIYYDDNGIAHISDRPVDHAANFDPSIDRRAVAGDNPPVIRGRAPKQTTDKSVSAANPLATVRPTTEYGKALEEPTTPFQGNTLVDNEKSDKSEPPLYAGGEPDTRQELSDMLNKQANRQYLNLGTTAATNILAKLESDSGIDIAMKNLQPNPVKYQTPPLYDPSEVITEKITEGVGQQTAASTRSLREAGMGELIPGIAADANKTLADVNLQAGIQRADTMAKHGAQVADVNNQMETYNNQLQMAYKEAKANGDMMKAQNIQNLLATLNELGSRGIQVANEKEMQEYLMGIMNDKQLMAMSQGMVPSFYNAGVDKSGADYRLFNEFMKWKEEANT